jgi:hypothetical protein
MSATPIEVVGQGKVVSSPFSILVQAVAGASSRR